MVLCVFSFVRGETTAGGDILSSRDMCCSPKAEVLSLFGLFTSAHTTKPYLTQRNRSEVSALGYVTTLLWNESKGIVVPD